MYYTSYDCGTQGATLWEFIYSLIKTIKMNRFKKQIMDEINQFKENAQSVIVLSNVLRKLLDIDDDTIRGMMSYNKRIEIGNYVLYATSRLLNDDWVDVLEIGKLDKHTDGIITPWLSPHEELGTMTANYPPEYDRMKVIRIIEEELNTSK